MVRETHPTSLHLTIGLGAIGMEKISDYQMLQMAYDYQYNKDDLFNAAIWLHKLMM